MSTLGDTMMSVGGYHEYEYTYHDFTLFFQLRNNCDVTYIDEILFLEIMKIYQLI